MTQDLQKTRTNRWFQRPVQLCRRSPVIAGLTAVVVLAPVIGLSVIRLLVGRGHLARQPAVEALKTADFTRIADASPRADTVAKAKRRAPNEAAHRRYLAAMNEAQMAWNKNDLDTVQKQLHDTPA